MGLFTRIFFGLAGAFFLIVLYRINYLIVVVPGAILAALFVLAIVQKIRRTK